MISIIAAAAENWAIGRKNDLPWNLSGDLKNFSKTTTGHTVLMGLNTFKSIVSRIGKPLPNRKNIVLTFQKDPSLGVEQVTSAEEVLELAKKEDLFVIGGASVYKQLLPYASKLYLTKVYTEISDADAFFPAISEKDWKLVSSEPHQKDEKNDYDFTFLIYEKI